MVQEERVEQMKKWFENLRISRKLIVGFLFITFLGMVIGGVGIFNLVTTNQSRQNSYDQCTMGIVYSTKAQISFQKLRSSVRDLYMYYGTDRQQYTKEISSLLDTVDAQLKSYEESMTDSEDQKNYESTQTAFTDFKGDVNQILEASDSGKTDQEILAVIKSAKDKALNADKAFETLSAHNTDVAAQRIVSDQVKSNVTMAIMILLVVVCCILSVFASVYISGMISRPITKLAAVAEMLALGDIEIDKTFSEEDKLLKHRKDEVGKLAASFTRVAENFVEQSVEMQKIAEGDLTSEVTVRSEADVLGKALSDLVKNLHDLAFSIVSSSDQVNSSAKLVADTSISISQGATEQAGSIEELTASLEEITSRTTENAQNARTANELTGNVREDARNSSAQMEEMLGAMKEINESSESIQKIIKVIDDIAFQTNILALNAAVEAARAGDYGKGFAVVAEEVRSLAAKSADAAKETTHLIEDSMNKVETGTKMAGNTSAALNKIVSGVAQAAELVGSIASASNEQAEALEQINQGILQVSQVVQSNAAASEECASAGEELSGQAGALKESVGVFKL